MTKRVIGLLLMVVGLALGFLIARQTLEFLSPYVWQPSQCVIQKSDVLYGAQTNLQCRHALEYRYEYLFGLIFLLGLPIGAGLWWTARRYL